VKTHSHEASELRIDAVLLGADFTDTVTTSEDKETFTERSSIILYKDILPQL
jgi:hypothetical protein